MHCQLLTAPSVQHASQASRADVRGLKVGGCGRGALVGQTFEVSSFVVSEDKPEIGSKRINNTKMLQEGTLR